MRRKPRAKRRAMPSLESLDSRALLSTSVIGSMAASGSASLTAPTSGSGFFQNGFNYGTFGPDGTGLLRGRFHGQTHATKPIAHGRHLSGSRFLHQGLRHNTAGANTSGLLAANVPPPAADPPPPAPTSPPSGTGFFQNGFNYGTIGPDGTGILR